MSATRISDLQQLDGLHDVLTRDEAGPDRVELLERGPGADPGHAGGPVVVQRHALGEDLPRLLGVRTARGVPDDDLRRLGVGRRRDPAPPHRRVPDVLDDLLAVHEARAVQAALEEGQAALRLLPGARPGVAELDLADEARAVAHV